MESPKPITGVLLVPEEAFREALLGDGACGARVPTAWRNPSSDLGPSWGEPLRGNRVTEWADPVAVRPPAGRPGHHGDMYVYEQERALVLAWEGRVVREGRNRALAVLAEAVGRDSSRGACWYYSGGGWTLATPFGGGEHFSLRVAHDAPQAPLVDPWALAVVCAARGLGRVEVVR